MGGPKIVALTPKVIKSLLEARAVPMMESTFTATDVNVSSHSSMNESNLFPCLVFHA